MSTFITAPYVGQLRNEYSENLLSYESTFNNDLTFNITSGVGSVTQVTNIYFEGFKCLKIESLEDSLLTFQCSEDLGFTCQNDGNYIFSFRVYCPNFLGDEPNFNINIFKNGVFYKTIQAFFTDVNILNNWLCFAQTLNFNNGDVITFSMSYQSGLTESQIIYVDGLKCEFDNLNLGIPTNWSVPINYCCGAEKILISETQWDVSDIGTNNINDGDSLNLFTLINNSTHKNITNSDTYDQLNIVSNAIRTTYRNGKIIHNIRIALNISAGSDQHYQMQIRRVIDNSIVYRALMQRNPDEATQTIEMTTRTLSESDPFVIDGFYIAFVNNSGATATINGTLSLVIISSYQKAQNGFT